MGCGASKTPSVSEPVAVSTTCTSNNNSSKNLICHKEATPSTIIDTSAQNSICNRKQQQDSSANRLILTSSDALTSSQFPVRDKSPVGLCIHNPLLNNSQPIMSDDPPIPFVLLDSAEEIIGTEGSENGSPLVAHDVHKTQTNHKRQASFTLQDGTAEFLSKPLITDHATLYSISEFVQQRQAWSNNDTDGRALILDAEHDQVNKTDECLETHENLSYLPPSLLEEDYSTLARQASPLPISTGGDHGIVDETLVKPLPQPASDVIAQGDGGDLLADKAEAIDGLLIKDPDFTPVDGDNDSGKEEEDELKPEMTNEIERIMEINVQDSITKLSDLTEGDCSDKDSTRLSTLTDVEKCSRYDLPLHYLSGGLTQLAQEAVSSMRNDYKLSTPSSSGSSELDTDTYMQDLIQKINLTKESMNFINDETNSSSILQDLDIANLYPELQDIAYSSYRLQDSDSQMCVQTKAQEFYKEREFSQIP